MAKIKEKKSFHPVRHIRLDEETMEWLKKIKRGTWNNTFNKLRKEYITNKIKEKYEIQNV